jgi:hypothetical protein
LDKLIPHWREYLDTSLCGSSQRILNVKSYERESIIELICKQFPNIIKTSKDDCIKEFVAEIIMEKSFRPIFHKPYTVAYSYRKHVESELERLVNEGVLTPVKHSEHEISKNGIEPCKDKDKAICEAPTPQNVKELQAYLGLLNYLLYCLLQVLCLLQKKIIHNYIEKDLL